MNWFKLKLKEFYQFVSESNIKSTADSILLVYKYVDILKIVQLCYHGYVNITEKCTHWRAGKCYVMTYFSGRMIIKVQSEHMSSDNSVYNRQLE